MLCRLLQPESRPNNTGSPLVLSNRVQCNTLPSLVAWLCTVVARQLKSTARSAWILCTLKLILCRQHIIYKLSIHYINFPISYTVNLYLNKYIHFTPIQTLQPTIWIFCNTKVTLIITLQSLQTLNAMNIIITILNKQSLQTTYSQSPEVCSCCWCRLP